MNFWNFFKEDNGRESNVRLLAFLSILFFVVNWGHSIFTTGTFDPPINLIIFVLTVVGLKVTQKFTERKSDG